MEIFQFPLDVEQNPAEHLRRIPGKGFVQVLRADDSATLRIKSASGVATPAVPGIVLPADKGIYLQTREEIAVPANTVSKRGFLLLAWYETRDEIIPLSSEHVALPMRMLVSNGADNALAFADVEPANGVVPYALGIVLGYTGANPAGTGPATLNLTELSDGAGGGQQLFGLSFNPGQPASIPRQVWFPRPIFSRPGWGLRVTISASGAVGSISTAQLFGGSFHV